LDGKSLSDLTTHSRQAWTVQCMYLNWKTVTTVTKFNQKWGGVDISEEVLLLTLNRISISQIGSDLKRSSCLT